MKPDNDEGAPHEWQSLASELDGLYIVALGDDGLAKYGADRQTVTLDL